MKNKEKWCAILMSATEKYDPSKCGFNTEDEAWEYVVSHSCESCRNSDFDMCSAEWEVCTEEDWNED